jgi:hypothetical protein
MCHIAASQASSQKGISSLFVQLVADGWYWFVLREKYCWLVGDGWFGLREKYCWLVADKPNEQGAGRGGCASGARPQPAAPARGRACPRQQPV